MNSFPPPPINPSLPPQWKLERKNTGQPVLHTGFGRPFSLEMSEPPPLQPGQPLFKAIGYKGRGLTVLDITAGWGQDARLIAGVGCEVTAVEQNEVVFTFLDFLNKNPGTGAGKLNFILDDSFHYLKTIKTENKPDIIYMDPMFQPNRKAASGKSLWILQQITETDEKRMEALFKEALKKCREKVVVKKWRRDKSFNGPFLCSFSGRAIRFDVFAPSP